MISFKQDKFIRKSQLVSGNAYVWKDGHVRIYLGIVRRTKEMVFYTVGSMAFCKHSQGIVMPLWGDRQVCCLLGMCQSIFQVPYNFSAIATYSSMPAIYGSIGSVFTEETIENWLSCNKHGNMLMYSSEI